MQIREQGKKVQLIRSPYDREKKRCVQVVAHTFERRYSYSSADLSIYLSAEQLADLSDSERAQLSDWIKAKADKQTADGRKNAIMFADVSIIRAADAILSDGVDEAQAAKIWGAVERLGRALKKAGRPRSSTRATAVPVPVPGQGALTL